MKYEIIQRVSSIAGGILKEYDGKSPQQGAVTDSTPGNIANRLVDQIINALGGSKRDGGQGSCGGRGRSAAGSGSGGQGGGKCGGQGGGKGGGKGRGGCGA